MITIDVIRKTNSKFLNQNVVFLYAGGMVEGIYIGSWRRDHYSFIVFSHEQQSAEICHLPIDQVMSVSLSRQVDSDERMRVITYLKKNH